MISKVQEFENGDVNVVHVPVHGSTDGLRQYTIDLLYSDQKRIVTEVVAKLHEWLECDDLSAFQPLRMTVMGAEGTGTSVVINTIVTIMRNMFEYDGVVRIAAPTGFRLANL